MIATHIHAHKNQNSDSQSPQKKLDVLEAHLFSQFTVKQTPELAGSESSGFSESRLQGMNSRIKRLLIHPHIHTDTYMSPHGNRYACMHHT